MDRCVPLLVRDLNSHLICTLCKGYLVDATTITECLHSFCRSCIVKYMSTSKYCPKCEAQVHKTRPFVNLRSDNILQALVNKLVPGLHHEEMKRRRECASTTPASGGSRGGRVASSTNASNRKPSSTYQVEDVAHRVWLEPEHQVSLVLQFFDRSAAQSTGPDGSAGQAEPLSDQRFLRCAAKTTVNALKKYLRRTFDIAPPQQIELFCSLDEGFRDTATLADVAYVCEWTQMEPLLIQYYAFDSSYGNHFLPKRAPTAQQLRSAANYVSSGAAATQSPADERGLGKELEPAQKQPGELSTASEPTQAAPPFASKHLTKPTTYSQTPPSQAIASALQSPTHLPPREPVVNSDAVAMEANASSAKVSDLTPSSSTRPLNASNATLAELLAANNLDNYVNRSTPTSNSSPSAAATKTNLARAEGSELAVQERHPELKRVLSMSPMPLQSMLSFGLGNKSSPAKDDPAQSKAKCTKFAKSKQERQPRKSPPNKMPRVPGAATTAAVAPPPSMPSQPQEHFQASTMTFEKVDYNMETDAITLAAADSNPRHKSTSQAESNEPEAPAGVNDEVTDSVNRNHIDKEAAAAAVVSESGVSTAVTPVKNAASRAEQPAATPPPPPADAPRLAAQAFVQREAKYAAPPEPEEGAVDPLEKMQQLVNDTTAPLPPNPSYSVPRYQKVQNLSRVNAILQERAQLMQQQNGGRCGQRTIAPKPEWFKHMDPHQQPQHPPRFMQRPPRGKRPYSMLGRSNQLAYITQVQCGAVPCATAAEAEGMAASPPTAEEAPQAQVQELAPPQKRHKAFNGGSVGTPYCYEDACERAHMPMPPQSQQQQHSGAPMHARLPGPPRAPSSLMQNGHRTPPMAPRGYAPCRPKEAHREAPPAPPPPPAASAATLTEDPLNLSRSAPRPAHKQPLLGSHAANPVRQVNPLANGFDEPLDFTMKKN